MTSETPEGVFEWAKKRAEFVEIEWAKPNSGPGWYTGYQSPNYEDPILATPHAYATETGTSAPDGLALLVHMLYHERIGGRAVNRDAWVAKIGSAMARPVKAEA